MVEDDAHQDAALWEGPLQRFGMGFDFAQIMGWSASTTQKMAKRYPTLTNDM